VGDEEPKGTGPFDVATIRALVALMGRHDLSEIDLHNGTQRIRLRRGPGKTTINATAAPLLAAAPQPTLVPPPPKPAATDAAAPQPTRKLIDIKSPTPGTFYSRPNPEAEPYVKVGSRVEPKSIVCQIEAMKLYTEIEAGCSGVIAEIVVENAQAVEFDQVLFRVNPT
jgi:acetyl-CoA carboxylase biotin carboxyl carrier protein